MKDSLSWIFGAVTGVLFLLLLNISPLAHMGLGIELPGGWQNAPTSAYRDHSCNTRRVEGIPFATKRSNQFQTCAFDVNKLAILLNGATGAGLGLLAGLYTEKRHNRDRKSVK